MKKEPPPLYIPLRKQQLQLSGHFVNVETGSSNEVEEDSLEDSEMMWLDDDKEDLKGVRKELLWPSKPNRLTPLSKNSFYSLRPGQM